MQLPRPDLVSVDFRDAIRPHRFEGCSPDPELKAHLWRLLLNSVPKMQFPRPHFVGLDDVMPSDKTAFCACFLDLELEVQS